MKLCICFLLILLSFRTFAQSNLVTNPSFEQMDSCPTTVSQVHFASGWSSYKQSADYFNFCNFPSYLVGIPFNISGYQNPHTGNAYMGIQTFFTPGTREIFGSQLVSPLIIGQEYFISMYICCGYDTSLQGVGIACASNKLGVKFSTVSFDINNPVPIDNFAHIYSDSLLTDTVDWIQIEGSFVADSAYNYIMIGNFFDDLLTDTLQFINGYSRCYYLIDDICVSNTNECILFSDFPDLESRAKLNWYLDPFNNNFVIDMGETILSSIDFYNIFGQRILDFDINKEAKLVQCALGNLRSGIYFAKVVSKKNEYIIKFIIY